MAKCAGRILQHDIQKATGTLQTCTSIDGGIEATVHAMDQAFHDSALDAILLVDANNAFNTLNRGVSLANIRKMCPTLYIYIYK